jgi:hypothetical protein
MPGVTAIPGGNDISFANRNISGLATKNAYFSAQIASLGAERGLPTRSVRALMRHD